MSIIPTNEYKPVTYSNGEVIFFLFKRDGRNLSKERDCYFKQVKRHVAESPFDGEATDGYRVDSHWVFS